MPTCPWGRGGFSRSAGRPWGERGRVVASPGPVIRLGYADVPMGAGRLQLFGVALLCGIGFTMSLFIGLLAFANDPLLQEEVKLGILTGSIIAGLLGWTVPRAGHREI